MVDVGAHQALLVDEAGVLLKRARSAAQKTGSELKSTLSARSRRPGSSKCTPALTWLGVIFPPTRGRGKDGEARRRLRHQRAPARQRRRSFCARSALVLPSFCPRSAPAWVNGQRCAAPRHDAGCQRGRRCARARTPGRAGPDYPALAETPMPPSILLMGV